MIADLITNSAREKLEMKKITIGVLIFLIAKPTKLVFVFSFSKPYLKSHVEECKAGKHGWLSVGKSYKTAGTPD